MDQPIRAEVAVWNNEKLKRVAALRQERRSSDHSIYIDLGPNESRFIYSFHTSGLVNSKIVDIGGRVPVKPGRESMPDGKTRVITWDPDRWKDSESERRVVQSNIVYLKMDMLSSYPDCKYRPEIIFALTPDQQSIGFAFYPLIASNRYTPTPTMDMAFGYTDATLPPMFVLASYASIVDFLTAKEKNYKDPAFDVPPHPAYCTYLNFELSPVICAPDFDKQTGMKLYGLNEVFDPPQALRNAYTSLAPRPGRMKYDIQHGKKVDLESGKAVDTNNQDS